MTTPHPRTSQCCKVRAALALHCPPSTLTHNSIAAVAVYLNIDVTICSRTVTVHYLIGRRIRSAIYIIAISTVYYTTTECKFSWRPWLAKPSPWRLNQATPSTTWRPRSRTRKAFHQTNSDWETAWRWSYSERLQYPEGVNSSSWMQIFMRTLTGKTITLEVDQVTPYVKAKIHAGHSIRPTATHLCCMANNCKEDSRALSEVYSIQRMSTCHLVLRLRGGIQIFMKTLTGKTVTLEVEPTTPSPWTITLDHHLGPSPWTWASEPVRQVRQVLRPPDQ